MDNEKIRNAVILATGMGTRLQPVTHKTPKCLTLVNGIPIIEKQIQILNDLEIESIYIISGYMGKELNYLSEKYENIEIRYNDKFALYNNLYSLSLAIEELDESLILDGDVYIDDSCLPKMKIALKKAITSFFFTTERFSSQTEWIPVLEENGYIEAIYTTKQPGINTMLTGISFLKPADSQIIREKTTEYIETGRFKDLFWEDIILENCQEFHIKTVNIEHVYEIDTVEDLKQLNKIYNYDNKYLSSISG